MTDKTKFIEQIVLKQIISQEDCDNLVAQYQGNTSLILKNLLKRKIAKKNILGKIWGDFIGFSYVDLNKTLFQSDVIKKLPEAFAKKNKIIPLYQLGGACTVATSDPLNHLLINEVEKIINMPVSTVFSFMEDILDAIEIQYKSKRSIEGAIDNINTNILFQLDDKITPEQLKQIAGDQSIVELCRNIMLLGIKEKASDIHIEPQEFDVKIRFRIDGVLHDKMRLDLKLLSPVVSRFKILANLDITEKRRPQDGRIALQLSEKSIDFRFSTVPIIYGEKIVMRILGQMQAQNVPKLSEMQLSKFNLNDIQRVVNTPNGVFFVTGPTGSGKSTTLFSVLDHLNKPEINIMTIEDPVEYRLQGINQVQVNKAINLTFVSALRSFLRQDPNVILIGEIRDLETARIASQAALTGHLVLATMHTNNALQAVTRLIEIGVEPFLVAPSIIGVMAQRLVRKICTNCKEKYQLTPEEIEKYFVWNSQRPVYFFKGKGCAECNNTGYSGRLAIHELFLMTEEIRTLVAKGVSILEIEKKAKESGFKPMRYDGIKKVLRGLTTIEEIDRVTISDW